MIKKALLALAITGAMATAQANVVVNESFENVAALTSNGWIINNKSTPLAATGIATTWFQGDPSSSGITSHLGNVDNAYISANFNSAATGGLLNDFLETPVFSTNSGVIVSFFLNATVDPAYFDQVDFGFIDAATGVFSSALSSVLTVTTGQWTQYTVTLAAATGSARFAIDYTGAQLNANEIALDDLTVTVPEPTSIAILAAGLIGFGAARRRKQRG